ncbi:unnamed protein product [Adineta ricciae]|uniref:Uncharacterized protein n=1 Tax=Adineta ricciae TaxID=249248 RepID=A0A814LAH9_ADIRI|nr:unnamed protein product [Adineta ricciae]CAF1402151.1 unnamed protein product [Adineta ricciae]
MTTTNLLTELDIKEHGVIERWRYLQKSKEAKLKSKHSSIDQATLAQQIHDKNLRNKHEQTLSNAYACDQTKHDAIVQLLSNRQEHDRRRLAEDLNVFRAKYQQATDARESDLNLNDITQSINSSCLYFDGEDRNKPDRERKQKNQMTRWIVEQCRQKCLEIEEQRMTDRAYDYNQLAVVDHLKTLEAIQMKRRRQLSNNIKAFNQAEQKQCQRRVRETMEYEDKKQEITNMLTEEILTEKKYLSKFQFSTQHRLLIRPKDMSSSSSTR